MGRGVSLATAAILASAATAVNAEPLSSASTASLVDRFKATLTPSLSLGRLVEAPITAVGCPQDGQLGPVPAPDLPTSVRAIIPEGFAPRLAYYSASETPGTGVVGPRGWACFGVYGSSGQSLLVMPQNPEMPMPNRDARTIMGPVVIRNLLVGGTSGRLLIAKVSARAFPIARKFVERVRDAGLGDPREYVFAPWPADQTFRLSDFAVAYVTPPGADGLGTIFGPLPARDPVNGLALLTGVIESVDEPSLVRLAVRLDEIDQNLYPAIAINLIASVASEVGDADSQASPRE